KEADKKAPTLTVRSRSLFLRIAVAATLAFGLFGLWQYTSQSSGEVWQVAQTNAQKGDNKLLSDGTVVSINANTKLEFPEEFKNTERRVRLDGEAFFDVARDTEHPFIIEMEGATIKVLGTSFNIRSYGDEIELTVKSGKVAFKAEDGNKSWELIKGDQLVYKRSERTVKMQRDEQLNAIAWKRGSLVFVDTQLKEALRYMTNYYGVIFQLENAKLQNCKLNLNYEQTTVADALDILATIYQLQVRQESPKKYILSGGNCK
ncbi:MAG: FecR domain-containing protein, partial [Bacteroidota bacterium]